MHAQQAAATVLLQLPPAAQKKQGAANVSVWLQGCLLATAFSLAQLRLSHSCPYLSKALIHHALQELLAWGLVCYVQCPSTFERQRAFSGLKCQKNLSAAKRFFSFRSSSTHQHLLGGIHHSTFCSGSVIVPFMGLKLKERQRNFNQNNQNGWV